MRQAGDPRAATAGRPRQRRGLRRVVLVLVALTGLVLLRVLLVDPMTVHGRSMEPGLRDGDVVLVSKPVRPLQDVRRGEVVVFEDDDGRLSVKRVVALPGDRLSIEDGVLQLDRARPAEPYLHPRRLDGVYFGPVVVPAGTVFVLGDNRTASVDSRDHGAVELDRVVGRVVLRVWPPRL